MEDDHHLEPIYGNGWFSGQSQQGRDVPAPFKIKGELDGGTITTVGHEFLGATARLSPRYAEPTDYYNVTVERGDKVIAFGYVRAT